MALRGRCRCAHRLADAKRDERRVSGGAQAGGLPQNAKLVGFCVGRLLQRLANKGIGGIEACKKEDFCVKKCVFANDAAAQKGAKTLTAAASHQHYGTNSALLAAQMRYRLSINSSIEFLQLSANALSSLGYRGSQRPVRRAPPWDRYGADRQPVRHLPELHWQTGC